jgi:NAD(P)-dependent dehydrogenase (short-subunit alcohol dehydrogenase family)
VRELGVLRDLAQAGAGVAEFGERLQRGVGQLGAGMAEALARAGAAVVIGDIREELGEATADAIKKSGAQAAFLPLDVTDDASWERAISGAIAELGGLDIVVNNAGVEISSLVIDLDPDDVRKMLEVNILGTSLGIKHAFRAMRPGGPAGPMALL